jgi:DNA-binding SARP family transcriptional activator
VSVTYGILGPLIVHPADGGELAVTSPRQRTILAMLLLSANQPVTTSRLVDAVWPDNPPRTSREQIQNCVGLLRRGLLADIERRPSGYRLQVPEDALDAAVFAGQVAAAERYLAGGEPVRAQGRLLGALRLWRGRVLEDVDSAEVASAAIRLQELHSSTVMRYVDLAGELGAGDVDLVAELNRWCVVTPLHEGISARLARALWRSGRAADALTHLRRLRARLAAEFGVLPAPDTQALEAEILASVVPDPAAHPEPSDPYYLVRAATQHLAAAAHILDRLLAEPPERVHSAPVGRLLDEAPEGAPAVPRP